MQLFSMLDAPIEVFDHGGQRKRMTWLSSKHGDPGTGPELFYSETLGTGATTRSHFHRVDQFQLFYESGQRLGGRAVEPVSLHYADAHTPYGPIVGIDGVHYLTVRARRDPGACFMPESHRSRRYRGGRHFNVRVPTGEGGSPAWTLLVGEQSDELAASVCVARPGDAVTGCGPAIGAGRAHVVVSGTMLFDDREHAPMSSIFLQPGADLDGVRAGPDGMVMVALSFPSINSDRPNAGLQ